MNLIGYLGLMAFSFLAATVIPVSSEAALAGGLASDMQPMLALLFATIGNCAGVPLNYWLGYKGEEKLLHKHLQKRGVAKAYEITQRWGKWSLLLSWLPVVGDPITILAGILRMNYGFFCHGGFFFAFFALFVYHRNLVTSYELKPEVTMKLGSILLQGAFVFTLFVLISCNSADNQEQADQVAETEVADEGVILTPEARLQNVKADLKAVKADLTKDGKYDCCVHPTCDWCALKEGKCTCHDNITVGKAVCPDCGLGWHNGEGSVSGVKASRVKWDITHEHPGGGDKH